MIKIIGIMCAVVTLANAGPLAIPKADFSRVFSSAMSLSSQCETARQSQRLKDCINTASVNMHVMISNINAWYQENPFQKDQVRQKLYPAICCTIRDMKSCVLTITQNACTKDEQNQIIEKVEDESNFQDKIYQVNGLRMDCNLFGPDQTCPVSLDDDHKVTPSDEPLPSMADSAVKDTAVDIRLSKRCQNILSSKAVPQCLKTIKSSHYYTNTLNDGQCCVSWEAVDCLIDIAFDDCSDADIQYLTSNVNNNLLFNRIDCTKYSYHSQTCGGKYAGQPLKKHNQDNGDKGTGGGAGSVSASLFLSLVFSALVALLRN